MAMMRIREMRVAVGNGGVPVPVAVTRSGRDRIFMPVVMMFVAGAVLMVMAVFERLMGMCMFVAFGQMQPYAPCHQRACDHQ